MSKKLKRKVLFILTMLLIGISISYKYLEKSKITLSDKEIINLIINNSFQDNNYLLERFITKTVESTNPIKKMNKMYKNYLLDNTISTSKELEPIIYLYNTHQSEEYASSNYIEFSMNPTVIINNYILQDIF